MENFTLQPLTEYEKRHAEQNHGLVYSFLHKYEYSIEEYYNIVIFGYLRAVQVYNRRKDLQKQYHFACIAYQYMRSAIGNHFKLEQSKKRKPVGNVVSLDANYGETENLYNCTGANTFDVEVIAVENIAEILKSFTDVQRKITGMKMDGYNNKEIYLLLDIKPSTYYKEMQRIKTALEKLNV